MGLLPELLRLCERIDSLLLPPVLLGAEVVKGTMVDGAKRDRPFVADLAPERARLGEAQMVSLAGRAATDEAGEGGDKAAVQGIAQPLGRGERQLGFVDGSRRGFLLGELCGALLIELLQNLAEMRAIDGREFGPGASQMGDRSGIARPDRLEPLQAGGVLHQLAQGSTELLG